MEEWMKDVDEYNKEPVHYCKHCLSLNIQIMDDDFDTGFLDFCADCGSTDIEQTDIHTWEKMYEQKYKKNFKTGEEI